MNLVELLFPNGLAGASTQELLRHAGRIRDQLPEASPGSQIAIAFGHDRMAFAAALLGTWLKGHGAAIVENALRERIMPVLDRPPVAMLLHDTGSARTLQVPRFLAATDDGPAGDEDTTMRLEALAASPLLTVHVQSDDGKLHWCAWDADELAAAIDGCAPPDAERPAANEPAPDQPAAAGPTPGLVSSLFANTLVPLRRGLALAEQPLIDARRWTIPGVPQTTSAHAELVASVLAHDGIEDAAAVTSEGGRVLLAVAGPGAERLAQQRDDTRAFAPIPRDPNGQAMLAEICLAFGLGRSGNDVTRQLTWHTVAVTPEVATLRTTIPTNYRYYEGHFEGYPVLAGGVQLNELVLPCVRELCAKLGGGLPQLQKLDSIKFLSRIGPGDAVEVVLQRGSDASKLTFDVRKQDVKCTTGRLHFAAELPAFPLPDGPAPTAT